jgi:hypothetical protein
MNVYFVAFRSLVARYDMFGVYAVCMPATSFPREIELAVFINWPKLSIQIP